ncbi:MAG: ABC transporter permease [Phycisphaeraceae bacterium]|nr:ABC transporter permease [Phycisphaeraceae bacterium]
MNLVTSIADFGQRTIDVIASFGRFTDFVLATAARLLRHPARCLRWRLLGPQLWSIGAASVPVVAITGAFIGMILALESFAQFNLLGQADRMGGIINVSVVKQIGPVLAAVMVAGRVGCALAAELGTMRVTEQLDAMRAMDADPIAYLVVPRVVACIMMTPILTAYSDILGSWGAWAVVVRIFGVPSQDYWHFTAQAVGWIEPAGGLFKSLFFGGAIGLIACYKGFTCGAGAAGVGRAATSAFVSSFIAIIMINLVLAQFLNTIARFIYTDPASLIG